ncbi:MAG: hypothetical protein ACT4QF_18660 [Sporichthyaceae bacterium]
MNDWMGGRARTLLEQLPAPAEGEAYVLVVIAPVGDMGVACEVSARRTSPPIPAEVVASVVAAAGGEMLDMGQDAFVDG